MARACEPRCPHCLEDRSKPGGSEANNTKLQAAFLAKGVPRRSVRGINVCVPVRHLQLQPGQRRATAGLGLALEASLGLWPQGVEAGNSMGSFGKAVRLPAQSTPVEPAHSKNSAKPAPHCRLQEGLATFIHRETTRPHTP